MGDQLKLYADCSAIGAIYIVKIDIQVPLINYILWGGGGGNKVCMPASMTECDVLLLGN